MKKKLILFANAFPYGTWEPFLLDELEYYHDFDEVIIFSLSVRDGQFSQQREINSDFTVVPIKFRKKIFYAVQGLKLIKCREFLKELAHLRKVKQLTFKTLLQATIFFSRANYEAEVVQKWLNETRSISEDDYIVLYSYRFLYQPYLMSKLRFSCKGIKKVARAHGSDLYEDRTATGYLPFRRGSLEALDSLVLISEHGLRYVQKTIPGFENKLFLEYMGTQDHGIAHFEDERKIFRIVTCSSMVELKRLDLVVGASAILPSDVQVSWTHFGDGPLREKIEASALMLPSNIQYEFRGATDNSRVLKYYASGNVDVLINTSSAEGLPVSIMEVFSFGIPVIATNVGGTSEIVEDGVNGLLLSTDPSVQEIADAILAIARLDEEKLLSIRTSARFTWELKFNADTNYPRFVSEVLLSSPGAQGHSD